MRNHVAVVDYSLNKIAGSLENLEDRTDDDDTKFDTFMIKAHGIITMLYGRKKDLYTLDGLVDSLEHDQEAQQETKPINFLSASKLPSIPIPTFSGKRWEWETFGSFIYCHPLLGKRSNHYRGSKSVQTVINKLWNT
ncbi:hypothetical protein V3C99_018675 [Haemonchus contortus]|uniref:Protein kinase domain-containing protein n=1 Tax=Haemonchus contortus TaxID=6289 RepID=A0A7I4Z1H2_HAECO